MKDRKFEDRNRNYIQKSQTEISELKNTCEKNSLDGLKEERRGTPGLLPHQRQRGLEVSLSGASEVRAGHTPVCELKPDTHWSWGPPSHLPCQLTVPLKTGWRKRASWFTRLARRRWGTVGCRPLLTAHLAPGTSRGSGSPLGTEPTVLGTGKNIQICLRAQEAGGPWSSERVTRS